MLFSLSDIEDFAKNNGLKIYYNSSGVNLYIKKIKVISFRLNNNYMFELLRNYDKKVPFLIFIYNEFDNIYDTRSGFYRTISKDKPTFISSSLYSLNDNINNIKK